MQIRGLPCPYGSRLQREKSCDSERPIEVGVQMKNRLLIVGLILSTSVNAWGASSLDLAPGGYGLSLGNSKRHNGLRLNWRDDRVEEVNGVNITLWKAGENPTATLNGIAIGMVGPEARDLNGVALGVLGVGAHQNLTGIALGGLGAGAGEDLTGLSFGLLGAGAGENLTGLALGGLVAGAGEELIGFAFGLLGAGAGERARGIVIGRRRRWALERLWRGSPSGESQQARVKR